MEEKSKITITAVQREMSAMHGVRRGAIDIKVNDNVFATITYIPDSSVVLVLDGDTYATGLGLITEPEKFATVTVPRLDMYLKNKHLSLASDNLEKILQILSAINKGTVTLPISEESPYKEKGSKPKRELIFDLGRGVLTGKLNDVGTLEVSYDDGWGNMPFSELIFENNSNKGIETLDASIDGTLKFANFTKITVVEALNHMLQYFTKLKNELAEAEKKKEEREAKKAEQEPKRADNKMVHTAMIIDIVEKHSFDKDKLLSLADFNFDYEGWILKVIEPIYRMGQRKINKDALEVKDNLEETYKNYQGFYKEFVVTFDCNAVEAEDTAKEMDTFNK